MWRKKVIKVAYSLVFFKTHKNICRTSLYLKIFDMHLRGVFMFNMHFRGVFVDNEAVLKAYRSDLNLHNSEDFRSPWLRRCIFIIYLFSLKNELTKIIFLIFLKVRYHLLSHFATLFHWPLVCCHCEKLSIFYMWKKYILWDAGYINISDLKSALGWCMVQS